MSDNLPTKKEYSAGGVVYKKLREEGREQSVVWLLGKHSGYHKWVLPKGMIEAGETSEETAVRETEEELAVKARIVNSEPVHIEKYVYIAEMEKFSDVSDQLSEDSNQPVRRIKTYQENANFEQTDNKVRVNKTVTFYLMEYMSGDPANHGWEMEDAGWYTMEEALDLLAFEGERQALRKAMEVLVS